MSTPPPNKEEKVKPEPRSAGRVAPQTQENVVKGSVDEEDCVKAMEGQEEEDEEEEEEDETYHVEIWSDFLKRSGM
jgi:hypothetical protein